VQVFLFIDKIFFIRAVQYATSTGQLWVPLQVWLVICNKHTQQVFKTEKKGCEMSHKFTCQNSILDILDLDKIYQTKKENTEIGG
jgi:hypothetical protein